MWNEFKKKTISGYNIDASDGYGITRQIKGFTDSIYESFDQFMHPKTQLKRENENNPDLTLTNPFLRRHKASKSRRRNLKLRNSLVASLSDEEDDEILGWIPINPPVV